MAEQGLTITALHHDLVAKRSFATVVWDPPDRHLVLPVPFGCQLKDLQAEAEKAVRSVSSELSTIPVKSA